MKVGRLIRFFSAYYPAWDQAYCRSLLDHYELDTNKTIKHLSKGMRAKLALVLALSPKPPVLILDEPTSGLDPVMKHEFLQDLRRLVEAGTTKAVLISSHIVGEIEQVADRIAVLDSGTLSMFSEKAAFLSEWSKIVFARSAGGIWNTTRGNGAVDNESLIIRQGDLAETLGKLKNQGATNIEIVKPPLQEVFFHLTKLNAYERSL
jgi:ABC-2 type transport system ATP-binding protein